MSILVKTELIILISGLGLLHLALTDGTKKWETLALVISGVDLVLALDAGQQALRASQELNRLKLELNR